MPANEIGLVARARGVATRLLSRPALEGLADAADLPEFARAVARQGITFDTDLSAADPVDVERAIRRIASRNLDTLRRWARRVPGILDLFSGELDRRSLRAVIRGAVAGAPTAARLSGLIPTPRLSERRLADLARQSSPSEVVSLLKAAGDRVWARLEHLVESATPDLFAIESVLLDDWAGRATLIARRQTPLVRAYVRQRIDLGNLQLALLLPGTDPADGAFVVGGAVILRSAVTAAAAMPSPRAAFDAMRQACGTSPLGAALRDAAADAGSIERAVLGHTLARLSRHARTDPIGPAYLLRTLLAIEAQAHDLRSLAWGAVFGAPPALRRHRLVTP